MRKPEDTMTADSYQRMLAQQDRPKKKRKPAGHEESNLQRSCVAWFRAHYPEHEKMLFAVPNGGGRSRIEGAIMKGEGVTAGVADLILLEARGGYGSLCIEMKTSRKSSRQRDTQKAWQEAAERAGNRYVVARTQASFEAYVTEYMAMQPVRRVVITAKEINDGNQRKSSLFI